MESNDSKMDVDEDANDCETGMLCEENCVICRKSLGDDKQKLYEKGLNTLIRASSIRGHTELLGYLKDSKTSPGRNVYVHKLKRCRADYTKDPVGDMKRCEDTKKTESRAKKLRSSFGSFNWIGDCFLCGKSAGADVRHPERNPVSMVTLLSIRDSVLNQCTKRDDPWAHDVMTRLQACIDLVAAEARYHSKCYLNFFRTFKTSPVGRPTDTGMQKSFLALCHWLDEEGESENMTLSEMHKKMEQLANGAEVYGLKSLRQKLREHYGDHIFWSQVKGGQEDVVCFRNMASYIVHEKWHSEKLENALQERERIVVTCAKLLREEIREQEYCMENYPSTDEIRDVDKGREFLTPMMRIFVESLIKDDLKRNSIGQAITQCVRPRSIIAPILFGTGVQMDHTFGSKWLIDQLFRLGFSISYDEVTLFKQSVLQGENLSTLSPPASSDITQWASDNADHDIKTIDGKNQFHGMGIIAMSAIQKGNYQENISQKVKRKAKLKVSELIEDKGISIIEYVSPALPALSSVKFKPILECMWPYTTPPVPYYANLMWQSARIFNKLSRPVPNYSGFMEHYYKSLDEGTMKCNILILPLIDLNPNDETCIYSTLQYINEQSDRLKQPSASVTFDQPLWQKAVEIVEAKKLTRVVCRLGGFHLLMSACGSVFNVMKGSGLEEAIGQVYGSTTVNHIITGKAISRALRAHFLVERALMTKLVSYVLPTDLVLCDPEGQALQIINRLDMEQIHKLEELLSRLMSDEFVSPYDILISKELSQLDKAVVELQTKVSSLSRTAKLWNLYLYYVNIIKEFIQCERSADWEGHLRAVSKLLNLFAASGHINYAKSARLYLQMMRELPDTHPWLYQKFVEGNHAVRRSNKYWAGLWTDLCIEQVLMRSMKSQGGLTRGRGMTESVRHQWVYSMHHCAAVQEAMSSLTNRPHHTSEQHVELGKSRSELDTKDFEKVLEWFEQHNPFIVEVPTLRSLSSGITASNEDGINCDESEEVGQMIQQSLDGASVNSAKIKRSDHVKTLQDLKIGIKVGNKSVHIEPAVLFMRCTAIAQRQSEDFESYFNHELSAIPTSLFKDDFMRKTDKAALARDIMKDLTNICPEANIGIQDSMHVIDGGWLLHRVRWKKNVTYQAVCEQYESYLSKMYGLCCIVFDGYQGPSTKDHEHMRRSGTKSADITVTNTAKCHMDQDAFFSNTNNKIKFIAFLSDFLKSKQYITKCSDGDADTLLVSVALNYCANGQSVVVVGEDTDIFIMLIHHWSTDMAELHFRKEGKSSQKRLTEIYSIRQAYEVISPVVRDNILFIHAWSGCDTTSSTFGQGKTHLLKSLVKSTKLQNLACKFGMAKTPEEISPLGISICSYLCGGKDDESLTSLRHRKYQEMVARCNKMEPERLPPTERAAHFHSLRVHLQVTQWAELNNKCLDACTWGWKIAKNVMCPVMTDLDAAPASVLTFIHCKCKVTNKKQCGTNQCSCHKNGLRCVTACTGCHGEICYNSKHTSVFEEDELVI